MPDPEKPQNPINPEEQKEKDPKSVVSDNLKKYHRDFDLLSDEDSEQEAAQKGNFFDPIEDKNPISEGSVKLPSLYDTYKKYAQSEFIQKEAETNEEIKNRLEAAQAIVSALEEIKKAQEEKDERNRELTDFFLPELPEERPQENKSELSDALKDVDRAYGEEKAETPVTPPESYDYDDFLLEPIEEMPASQEVTPPLLEKPSELFNDAVNVSFKKFPNSVEDIAALTDAISQHDFFSPVVNESGKTLGASAEVIIKDQLAEDQKKAAGWNPFGRTEARARIEAGERILAIIEASREKDTQSEKSQREVDSVTAEVMEPAAEEKIPVKKETQASTATIENDTESIHEVIPLDARETVMLAGETAKIVKEKNDPVSKLNNLFRERFQIEKELNRDMTPEQRNQHEERKRNKDLEIIRQECAVLGIPFEGHRKKLAMDNETAWQKAIRVTGYKDEQAFREAQRQYLLNTNGPEGIRAEFNALFQNTQYITDRQRRALLNGAGGLRVGGEFRPIDLTPADVAMCAMQGIDVNKISFGWFGLSNKIHIKGESPRRFDNMEQFAKFLNDEREKFVADKLAERIEQKKQEYFDRVLAPFLLRAEIQELHKKIVEKQNQQAQERQNKKAEAEAAALQAREGRKQAAEKLRPEERLPLLSEVMNIWKDATARDRKLKEIEQAIATGNFSCETEDGTKLKGKEAKQAMELYWSKMADERQALSDKIIDIAEKLTGRDLKKEAQEATGYKPGVLATQETLSLQAEYQKHLTDSARQVYHEQAEPIRNAELKKTLGDLFSEIKSQPELSIKVINIETPRAPLGRVKRRPKPLNYRGETEESVTQKIEESLTKKMLSSLSGNLKNSKGLSNDSEKLSAFFARTLRENIPASAIEQIIRSERYKEAVDRSVTDPKALAELLADFFLDRPWTDKANTVEKEPEPIKEVAPIIPAASSGIEGEALLEDLRSRLGGERQSNPDLNKQKIISGEGMTVQTNLKEGKELKPIKKIEEEYFNPEIMSRITGDFAKDASVISDVFFDNFGKRVSPRQFKDLVDWNRYRENAKTEESLTKWLRGFHDQALWTDEKRKTRKRK